MTNEKTDQPQSPEEMAKAAQQAAMKIAMEQAQAMYGNIPEFQMPNLTEAQEQLMRDVATIPGVAEAQAYQTEMMKQAAMNPEAMQKAYQQNLDFAQQMMQQAMGGVASGNEDEEDYFGFETDASWEITNKGDGKLTADMAKKTFHSWEEYGLSFAIGRGVWKGDTDDYETADEVISTLLRKNESPWKQIEW